MEKTWHIVLATATQWKEQPQRTRHSVAKALSQIGMVLFVELSQYGFPSLVNLKEINDPKIWIYTPKIPFFFRLMELPSTAGFAWKYVAKQIKLVMGKLKVEEFYLWSFDHNAWRVIEYLKPKYSIYYCNDPFMESTAEFEKETIAEKKRRIASMNMEHTAKRVKITTGTSPWIVEQLSEWNPNSYLSLPGSSQDILDYAMEKSAFNPSKHKREKIAVFLGSINNRLDFRLLSEIAEQLSDWKIVLAGPVYNMLPEDELIFDDLIKKSNVEYKKPLSRLEIADLLSNASAGLLPYSKDPKRKNMEHVVPHKLGDYISCGISIVSIETKFYKEAFAGNYGFPRGYIRVAKDAKGFAKCACEALNDYSMENMEKRFLFAQNNTFVHRVQFLIDKLQSMK